MTTYRKKNPFLDRRPYVYAILWTDLNMGYVGVRHAKGCDPSDLWNTYFTSSKYVREYRKLHGEPDRIEIIDTFLTAEEAIGAEHEILADFALHFSPVFLNKNCGGQIVMTEEIRKKVSDATKGRVPWNKGKKCKGTPAVWLHGKPAHNRGTNHSPEAMEKMMAPHRVHEYDGKLYALSELARLANLSVDGFKRRLRQGMSISEAVNTDSSALKTAANYKKFADPALRKLLSEKRKAAWAAQKRLD